jgi:23S rRNA-/tRNA-specific pseudouridylate synthase
MRSSVSVEMLQSFLASSHRPLKFRESSICQLLYEDKCILVIDKRAGFLTHPTDNEEVKTVRGALNRYMTARYKRRSGVIAVHRLDRGTSGILVFAKDDRIAALRSRCHQQQRQWYPWEHGSS